jgi:hypothetical protein
MKLARNFLIGLALLVPTFAIASAATSSSCCDECPCPLCDGHCPHCPFCNHAK